MSYVAKRLGMALLLLLGVYSVVFVIVRFSGDPARLYLPVEASERQIADLRESMGLDQPIAVQYVRAVGRLLRGDLGYSFGYGAKALDVIKGPLGATLILITASLVLSLLLAIPAGIYAALKQGSAIDSLITSFALVGQGLPTFWWALMLMLLFSVQLQLLPAFGSGTWKHLVLPTVTLGSFLAGAQARVFRSSLVQVLERDYVRTARSKGLASRVVILKHAFVNSLPASLTLVGAQLGPLVGGAVVTEYVFAYPGMGRLLVYAVQVRDFALTQAFVLVTATFIVGINLVVDFLLTVIDPRIRFR